jgi:DNA modification methylase
VAATTWRKADEIRVRRILERRGLRLERCRRRDPAAEGFGLYRVVNSKGERELAFALRADGWYLRSAVVWHKIAHLPDQARDRPASSYEHVLMLAKAPRYFYDADGIAEPASPSSAGRYSYEFGNAQPGRPRTAVRGRREHDGLRNARNVWSIPATGVGGEHPAMMPQELGERCIRASTRPGDHVLDPFGGLGTTGLAASALGRLATLIELSPKYATAARKRLGKLVIRERR